MIAVGLQKALDGRATLYREALDRLREVASDDLSNEVYDLTVLLREAVEIAHCARRLLNGRTVAEIHAAFGAPGDFGYGTPVGDALARIYRGEP